MHVSRYVEIAILFLNKNKHGTIVDSMFQHLPLISDMLHNPVPPLMTSPLMPLAQDSPSDPILDHSLSPSSSPSSSPPPPALNLSSLSLLRHLIRNLLVRLRVDLMLLVYRLVSGMLEV